MNTLEIFYTLFQKICLCTILISTLISTSIIFSMDHQSNAFLKDPIEESYPQKTYEQWHKRKEQAQQIRDQEHYRKAYEKYDETFGGTDMTLLRIARDQQIRNRWGNSARNLLGIDEKNTVYNNLSFFNMSSPHQSNQSRATAPSVIHKSLENPEIERKK